MLLDIHNNFNNMHAAAFTAPTGLQNLHQRIAINRADVLRVARRAGVLPVARVSFENALRRLVVSGPPT
jgi:hypothetical protein